MGLKVLHVNLRNVLSLLLASRTKSYLEPGILFFKKQGLVVDQSTPDKTLYINALFKPSYFTSYQAIGTVPVSLSELYAVANDYFAGQEIEMKVENNHLVMQSADTRFKKPLLAVEEEQLTGKLKFTTHANMKVPDFEGKAEIKYVYSVDLTYLRKLKKNMEQASFQVTGDGVRLKVEAVGGELEKTLPVTLHWKSEDQSKIQQAFPVDPLIAIAKALPSNPLVAFASTSDGEPAPMTIHLDLTDYTVTYVLVPLYV